MDSISIYQQLCNSRKHLKEIWAPGSGLHRHHITPKHSGGTDEDCNFTYLTPREHVIAHYLLWRAYKNPNDLRSMYMLGAKLTTEQRQAVGKYCFENKIGFYNNKFDSVRKNWNKKGALTQIENKIGIHNPENFKKHASIAGKASIRSKNNPWSYWASAEGLKERAKLGGKSLKGMKCVTNGKHRTRIKEEKLEQYLANGYRLGFTLD
jgi:hypothetical protein